MGKRPSSTPATDTSSEKRRPWSLIYQSMSASPACLSCLCERLFASLCPTGCFLSNKVNFCFNTILKGFHVVNNRQMSESHGEIVLPIPRFVLQPALLQGCSSTFLVICTSTGFVTSHSRPLSNDSACHKLWEVDPPVLQLKSRSWE